MGHATIYCHYCGNRIADKDLLAGRAVTLLDKTFCHDCKDQAFAQLSGEPAEEAANPATSTKTARSRTSRRPAGAEHSSRAIAPRRKDPRTLYIGIGVGCAAVGLVILLIALSSGGKADTPAKRDTSPQGTTGDTPGGTPRETGGGATKPPPQDPPGPAPVEQVRQLIKQGEDLIARDKDYAGFLEIRKALQDATRLAQKCPGKEFDLQKLQDYLDKYEADAKAWLDDRLDIVTTLKREQNYKHALTYIEAMPAYFKYAPAWKRAQDLKAELQRLK